MKTGADPPASEARGYLHIMVREEIMHRMRRYCDYQDRCHHEVRSRLLKLQVYGDELEEVITTLIGEDLLNEERFARSFVRGRHRIKGWGRMKIRRELKLRQVSEACIRLGMSEIDEDEYMEQLRRLLSIRSAQLTEDLHPAARRSDLQALAIRRGYEADLAAEMIRDLDPG